MEEEIWQVVRIASGLIQARIVAGRLEAEGIPVRLEYEPIGEIYAITVDGLGAVQILVPEQWAGHAAKVLSRRYSEEDLDWNNEEAQAAGLTPRDGQGEDSES
jgi:hypothetical protein